MECQKHQPCRAIKEAREYRVMNVLGRALLVLLVDIIKLIKYIIKFFITYIHLFLYGPVGSNHGNLQNTPLLALGYRALRELPRCTVRG